MDRLKAHPGFAPATIVIAFVLLVVFLYQTTTASLVELWTSGNSRYSHGLLLLGISIVLFCKAWMSMRAVLQLQANSVGIALLVATSLVWFLANLGHIQIIEQLCLPFVLVFLLWSLLGPVAAKRLAFPVLFMFFAIPLWDYLNIPLQRGTAIAVGGLMPLTGIAFEREGIFLFVPAGTFIVTESCSGLAQFIVAITIGGLYAYLRGLRLARGLLCVALAAVMAFLTNMIRIIIVVIAGQLTDMQHALLTDHDWLGWVVFGSGMAVFILLANLWLPGGKASEHRSTTGDRTASAHQGTASRIVIIQSTLVAFLGLTIGPALAHVYQSDVAAPAALTLAVPDEIAGWRADNTYAGNYRPSFKGADVSGERLYRNTANEAVYLHIAYYRYQRQGKEAIHHANTVSDGVNWISVARNTIQVPKFTRVKTTRIRSPDGEEKIVWRWYYVHGIRTSNDLLAKGHNILGILNNDPSIVVFTIAVDLGQSKAKSQNILKGFIANAGDTLERSVDVGVSGEGLADPPRS